MTDDMKSIGEVLGEMGHKPREVRPLTGEDYARITTDHWHSQKGGLWAMLLRKGVPSRFVDDLKAARTNETQALLAVEAWLKTKSPILVLAGDPQVGKTYACAYALTLRSKEIQTQFGAEPWLTYRYVDSDFEWLTVSQLAGLRNQFDPEVRSRAKQLENCGLLILDELGAPAWEDTSKPLEVLLGRRWANNRRTILTTNLSSLTGALQTELGDRVVERIRRVGKVVECTAKRAA